MQLASLGARDSASGVSHTHEIRNCFNKLCDEEKIKKKFKKDFKSMFNSHEANAAAHKCRSGGALTCCGNFTHQITGAPFSQNLGKLRL